MNFISLFTLVLLTGMASGCQSLAHNGSFEPVKTNAKDQQTASLMPIEVAQTQQCPSYTGLPPISEGTCSQLQWQALNSQLHNMSPAGRQRFLMSHVSSDLPGRLLWGLAYTQPNTGTAMRQLGQQALSSIYTEMPSALRPFLSHHIAMNQAMLSAAAQARGYRQANSSLHNDIIQLHITVQEKVQQIEALTDIESRLSSPPLLDGGTRTLNNPDEQLIQE